MIPFFIIEKKDGRTQHEDKQMKIGDKIRRTRASEKQTILEVEANRVGTKKLSHTE